VSGESLLSPPALISRITTPFCFRPGVPRLGTRCNDVHLWIPSSSAGSKRGWRSWMKFFSPWSDGQKCRTLSPSVRIRPRHATPSLRLRSCFQRFVLSTSWIWPSVGQRRWVDVGFSEERDCILREINELTEGHALRRQIRRRSRPRPRCRGRSVDRQIWRGDLRAAARISASYAPSSDSMIDSTASKGARSAPSRWCRSAGNPGEL
jgi:hypothetical protein